MFRTQKKFVKVHFDEKKMDYLKKDAELNNSTPEERIKVIMSLYLMEKYPHMDDNDFIRDSFDMINKTLGGG